MSILAKIPFKFKNKSHSFHIQKNGLIGTYKVKNLIAKGGNSFVYSAINKNNHNNSIIKEFFPQNIAARKNNKITPLQQKNASTFELGLNAIKHEATVLTELTEFYQFVNLIDAFSLNNSFYLVFKYEEGETLADYLAEGVEFNAKEVESLAIFLLDALDILHTKNILHRDLKPSNIFLSLNNPPFLFDFGSALSKSHISSSGFQCFRTRGYSPIELYDNTIKQGPWTDFFSLGATLYRCITGQNPIDIMERKSAIEQGLPDPIINIIKFYASNYPHKFLKTINWMMVIDADKRPSSRKQIINHLFS